MHIQTYTCLACKVLASPQLTHVVVWPWQVRRTLDSWSCGLWGPPIDGWGRRKTQRDWEAFHCSIDQIKTPEILNVFGFQFFLLLCEGYSLKEYPKIGSLQSCGPPRVKPTTCGWYPQNPSKSQGWGICDGNSDLDLHLPLEISAPSSKKHQRINGGENIGPAQVANPLNAEAWKEWRHWLGKLFTSGSGYFNTTLNLWWLGIHLFNLIIYTYIYIWY